MRRPRLIISLALALTCLAGAPAATAVQAAAPPPDPQPVPQFPAQSATAPGATASAAVAITASREAVPNPQCSPTATLTGIDARTAAHHRYSLSAPATGGSPVNQVGTSGWAAAREWAMVDEAGLGVAILSTGRVGTYRWNPRTVRYENLAVLGNGWSSVLQLIPQGRGVFYAVMRDGSLKYFQVSADGQRFSVQAALPGTSGWSGFSKITGGGDGVVYAVDAAGQLRQYRKTQPYQLTAGWASFGVVTPNLGRVNDIAGAGDGVIFATRPDGTLARILQYDPRRGTRTAAPATVPGSSGFATLRAFSANPRSCGDGVAQTRLRISQIARSWAGTGRSFCTTHTCTPGWWCMDFTWGVWADSSIGTISQFRTYPAAQEAATSDPITRYGPANGTNKGRDLQRIELGDIVVWPAQTQGGRRYVGHNAVVTAVNRDAAGRVVSVDLMHGNWDNRTVYQRQVTPWNSIGIAPGGWVSPRL